MTVLVTGGAGYIGSHMVHALADAGESVVVIDNLSTGFSAFVPEGVPLFIGDASDENLVEGVVAAHNIDSIIHFAGSVVVPDSMRDPLAYYRNNTMTTRSLLNVAVRCGVNRFIFSSTAAVYGNPDQVPVPGERTDAPAVAPTGTSKLMTEIMLHDVASAHGMSYVVLRYFNVAGADPQGRIGLATVGATAPPQDCGRSRPPDSAPRSMSTAPTIRRRMEAASATSSMSAISCRPIAPRWLTCATVAVP